MTVIYAALFIALIISLIAFAGTTFYAGIKQVKVQHEIDVSQEKLALAGVA